MTQHTPGPWMFCAGQIRAKRKEQGSEGLNKALFSYLPQPEMSDEEWLANGNLAALAPELLGALQDLSCYFIGQYENDPRIDNDIDFQKMAAERRALQLIVKATGGQL